MSLLSTLLGDPSKRYAKNLEPVIEQINRLERRFVHVKHDSYFREETDKLRARIQKGEQLDSLIPEAFALVREASRRTIGLRHFDVQLIGGIVLHQGKIAEMKTGEGKTLVATLAAYLNALVGKGVHVITVNDYLARRDVEWMGPVYHLLGLTTASLQHESAFRFEPHTKEDTVEITSGETAWKNLVPITRKEAYAADITYGTNHEYGFDYLRDNMVADVSQMAQRPLSYAIVDEVDSILIDEARTPLIISAPAEESAKQYYQFANLVKRLSEGEDYNVDEKMRSASLTDKGLGRMEEWLGIGNIYTREGIALVHHLEQALKAHALFQRDRDYVVRENEIIIVDEFTGRLLPGRRYSEGLHQAIEAKENVPIMRESRTLATITLQNYFRMYEKLAGMTGTAATEAEEFSKIYNLEVVVVPTHKPMVRKDSSDLVYKTEQGKFNAIVAELAERNKKGQPVLVGTVSIEKNERLSRALTSAGVPHEVLNAKNHEREAQVIAQAGKKGAVTVATNIAGRGVDIILGGNPPDAQEAGEVRQLGGLHVLGTERHEARRIDNQLRGRAGRQGDPGSSQFFVALDDDIMRIFGGERVKRLMETLGVPEDMPLEHGMVSRAIESAQHKVEGHNFDIRKHLLEYDDVMNKHREVVYRKRNEVLANAKQASEWIQEMISETIEEIVAFHTAGEDRKEWNIEEIYERVDSLFPLPLEERLTLDSFTSGDHSKLGHVAARTKLIEHILEKAKAAYANMAKRAADAGGVPTALQNVERSLILSAIDTLWVEHLEVMEHLRTGIGLRGYGQKDPLVEYKHEAYEQFKGFMGALRDRVVSTIFKINFAPHTHTTSETMLTREASQRERAPATRISGDSVRSEIEKVGRNDPCPCGAVNPETGQVYKYKKCGLINAPYHKK